MGSGAQVQHWFVTATHVLRTPGARRELPFGTAHVRMPGGAFTACGVPSMNWPIFWDLKMTDAARMCEECARTAEEYSAAFRRMSAGIV